MLLSFISLSRASTQAQQAIRLEFDVASVRQDKSSTKPSSNFSLDSGNQFTTIEKDQLYTLKGSSFSATNQPLFAYISFAYKLNGTQYLALRFKKYLGSTGNLPEWVRTDRFDIQAKAGGAPTKDDMRAMMQALLADRFGLVVHREARQAAVSVMVQVQPGKLGSRLHPHPADDPCDGDSKETGLPRVCGVIAHLAPSEPGRLSFGGRNVTMAALAAAFPTQTGMMTLPRPVVDDTGLAGGYDFIFEWAPELDSDAAPDAAVSGLNFAEALKQELGFKLESKKGSVEVLVIDQVERPSEN